MNRPYQVWSLFALFLLLACGGLGWLTHQSLQLDRAQAEARRQAEQEERIGLALWRMDAFLMPLLVREASRPDFVYSSNYMIATLQGENESSARTISPLLEAPPEFVRLHFQLTPDGRAMSPQVPRGEEREWSETRGIPEERIEGARNQLAELTRRLEFTALLAQLPELPPLVAAPELQTPDQNVQQAVSQPVVENFTQQQLARVPKQMDQFVNPPTQVVRPRGASQSVGTEAVQGESLTQAGSSEFNNVVSNRVPSQLRNMNNDLTSRNSVFQAYASRVPGDNRFQSSSSLVVAPLAREGVSRPIWVGEELLLARRVERDGVTLVQGCWLDWPLLRARLQVEVVDILPEVEFRPTMVSDVARSLATLPVQITTPAVSALPVDWSPTHLALLLAWVGLLLAAGAAAVTLSSVLALSERRAAFVAAVTHELRTPLTTFRMYAEMLTDGMVPPENQTTYLETLRAEADRLSHLVDNVLQYARLERGRRRPPRESATVSALNDRVLPRLKSRAEQAGLNLELVTSPEASASRVTTDAAALEQILFNLVDNACKYAAAGNDRRLHLEVALRSGLVVWLVRDHGAGISAAGRRRLFRPFSKTVQEAAVTAPGVGLGLALCHRLAKELGGSLSLVQSDETGTAFALSLPLERGARQRDRDSLT